MGNKDKIIIALIISSILLHIYSLSLIGDLKTQLHNVNSNVMNNTNSMNGISSSVGRLSRELNNLKEEKQWVKDLDFLPNIEVSIPGEIHLDVEWTFNELEKDSKAYLYYKSNSSDSWTEIAAKNLGGGIYKAPIILSPDNNYDCKVVVKGSSIKTGNTFVVPSRYYKPAPLMIRSASKSQTKGIVTNFSANFSQEPVLFDFYKVKNAFAKVYQGKTLVNTIQLKSSNSINSNLEFNAELNNTITSIVVEVEYGDGTKYQGEVYPDDKYMEMIEKQLAPEKFK